jgi:small subunit ribosomal protein S10e
MKPLITDRTPLCICAEGVLQAQKDFNLPEHPDIEGVPNLQVIKLMQSFTSRELVTERFAWRHYYW